MTRYAHAQGFHVERRFGWDCHGLPVEYEIDKTLGIKVRAERHGLAVLPRGTLLTGTPQRRRAACAT